MNSGEHMWKRVLSVVLILVMVFQVMPTTAFAVESDEDLIVPEELIAAEPMTDEVIQEQELYVIGEAEELREETVKHYRMSDGSFTAVQYSAPVNYKDESGKWQTIDNSLKATKMNGDSVYTSQVGSVSKYFAETYTGDYLFGMEYEDYSVRVSAVGEEERADGRTDANTETSVNVAAVVENNQAAKVDANTKLSLAEAAEAPMKGSEIKYKDVIPGVNYEYTSNGYNVKESIVVTEPQKEYAYSFKLELNKLEAVKGEGGEILLNNAEGDPVFVIPAPYMVDANGVYSEEVEYELNSEGESWVLSVNASEEWLNDSERAYPVIIDPSICYHANVENVKVICLSKGFPDYTSTSNIICGRVNPTGNTYGVCQMAIQIDGLPQIPKNCVIADAQMKVCYAGMLSSFGLSESQRNITASVYKLNENVNNFTSLTWNDVYGENGIGRDSTVLDYQKLNTYNALNYMSWDVTPAVLEWYADNNNMGAFVFVSDDEENKQCHASFVGHVWQTNSPYFIVHYRNSVGLENYYTYQTAGAGRAGTVYIGDFTSQLTLVNTDVSYGTEAVSAAVSHIYNTAYANQHFDKTSAYINTQNYSSMKVGLGWKLSVQQTLKSATIGDTEYLIYNDADGTEHYFPQTATNTYHDEDGLGLQIVKTTEGGNTVYLMTDTDAYNKWTFSNGGYLIKIADSNGNTVNINYTNGRITSVTAKANGGTTVTVATLAYNSANYLSSITDYRGQSTQYSYSTSGKLQSITYPDGTIVNYYYTTDGYITKTYDSESDYGLRFTYWENGHNGKVINQVREYTATSFNSAGTNDTLGNAFHAYKPSAQLTQYRFYGADHNSNMDDSNGDDIVANYVFDYAGRTICAYETDSTKTEVIGSSAASYTTNNGTSGKNNRLTGTGAMGMMYPNVYIDGGFENTWNVTGSGVSRNSRAETNVTNNSVHSGMYSMCLEGNGSYGVVPVTLEADKEYTFSFYVVNYDTVGWNTIPNVESSIRPVLMSSDGTEINISEFTPFKTQTSRSLEKGWEKVSWTFTTPAGSGAVAYKLGVKGDNFTGKVHVDDMQIEKSSTASQTNLVQNGKLSSTSCWAFYGASYNSAATSPFGSGAIKMVGSPSANRRAVQNININDEKGGTYILSGWGKATAVGSTANEYDGAKPYFGMLAAVVYTDRSDEEWHFVPFNSNYTDWQYASGIVVPKRDAPVKLIRVYLFYTNNANTAYFDNISLVREPCSSYTYDDKGNPVSAKDGGAKTNCEYQSGTSILTKYTASTGVVTNFTYEAGTHNLLTATSAGVTSTNTYNTMGLVNSTTLTNSSDQNLRQKSSAVYDSYGRNTSSTNSNNITTTNTYSNHFLTKTQTEDMPAQEYRYNVSNGRIDRTFMSGYAILHYMYGNGQLSDISRKSKVNGNDFWQSYHFEHDSFGNVERIGVSRANNDAAQNLGLENYRTLATYSYKRNENDTTNNGHLSKMIYGNGAFISYVYDIFDRVLQETYNDGTAYNYVYAADGSLSSKNSSTGESYEYEYDSLGRLIRSKELSNGSLVQRTEHVYDTANRLVKQAWYNGLEATSQTYAYSGTSGLLTGLGTYFPENPFNDRPGATNTPSVSIAYAYNGLNMLSGKTVSADGHTVYSKNYGYSTYQPAGGIEYTTNLVSELSYGGSLSGLTRQYTYDAIGNIASERIGSNVVNYTYDGQNQLTEVRNGSDVVLYSYTYDTAGNIRTKTDGTTTHNYAYDDPTWADLLTAYDNESIVYDAIGNPTSYYNGTRLEMAWEKGRQLASIKCVEGNTTGIPDYIYTYDMAGVRSSKSVNGTVYNFDTLSGKVMRQTWDGNTLEFIYDESNQPFAMRYKASGSNYYETYYYILNLQGDVVGLTNQVGNQIVQYNYDPWGKLLSIDTFGDLPGEDEWYLSTAEINPLRYRGYYYDNETGFYYLQSRYYDPVIGRFINADTYATTDIDGLISTNMFAYCENCPVRYIDSAGHMATEATIAITNWWNPLGWTAAAILVVTIAAGCYAIYDEKTDATAGYIKSKVDTAKDNRDTYDQSVYVLIDPNDEGKVKYVGRTNSPSRRESEHKRDSLKANYQMKVVYTGLTIAQAKVAEQALISAYTLAYLVNARREIAVGNLANSQSDLAAVAQLWEGILEDELLNLMRR